MGEYQIDGAFVSPNNGFDGAFVQATVPLEDEDENKAIYAWLYKYGVLINLKVQSCEITPKNYGQGLKLMKQLGYKGNGPIGWNNKGVIDPIKAIPRWPLDTIGLGFKKVPFHLGINFFLPEPNNPSK